MITPSNTGILEKYGNLIFLIVLLALSLFMVCWFGPVSEYGGHDYYFNIGRLETLMQALRNGTYPIYIDYDALEGYGYFTKGFYPDLIILPFAVLAMLIGTIAAYNTLIFTMTFLCGLFMYKAVKVVFNDNFVASVSAILYTFSAYHLFDWYNRAALGESISFTFLPLVFLGLYHIIVGDYKKWYLLTIGYSLLIYTHLLSSFLTFLTLVLLLIISYKPLLKEPKRIAYLLLAAVVTIPITGNYIFTMLEQMQSNTFYYQQTENITGQTKLGFSDLGWGALSGVLYSQTKNIAGTGPFLLFLIVLRVFVKEKSRNIKIADICALIGLVYIVMMSFVFPWGRLPLGFIQFPWRLYEFVTFFFAIAGAYYLWTILKNEKQRTIAFAGIILFTLVVFTVNNNNYKYWQNKAKVGAPAWFTGVPSLENEYYLGRMEYLPVKVPSYDFIHERGDSIRSDKDVAIGNLAREKGVLSFDITANTSGKLELPLIYYKGYRATLNSEAIPVSESEYGLVEISLKQSGKIEVCYEATTIQTVSWYVSLISIIALCVYIFVLRKKRGI